MTQAGAALLLALLLGGCPSPGARPAADGEAPQVAVPPAAGTSTQQAPVALPARPPQPAVRENRLSAATRSLVTQSHTQLARGDTAGASSTLDRALRIEPSSPILWTELGRVRLAENNPRQAESCGRKALALASGDHSAQAPAGRLLADALRAQGRNPEAQEVEARPFMR